jgi:hypothetical protein
MSTAGILHVFEDEFWNRNMDPRVRGFPMMDDGFPWKMISISLVYFLIVKYWNPKFKNIDLRPYLLIQNGFLFGCHGAGFVIALLLSNMGREGFDCNFDVMIGDASNSLTFDYIKSQSIVRLATVLMFLRIFMMSETIVLHKIMNGRQPSTLRVANDIVLFCFSYIGCKYLPGGPSLFFALCYISFYSFTYGYYTLRCGYNTNNNDHLLVLKWKKVFIALMFVWSILSAAHFTYLYAAPSCAARTTIRSLCSLELFHAAGTFISAVTASRKLYKYHSE